MSAQSPVSMKSLGRLLLVGVLGTVLAFALGLGAAAIAFAFPGRRLGYLTGPLAVALFVAAIIKLLRATEPKQVRSFAPAPIEDVDTFGRVLGELRATSKPATSRSGLFLFSLVAFVALGAGFYSVTSLALLLPILLLHELGHLAAMRAFGYRDLSVFFLPLLGAAASGKKESAPAWEQVIVALMGPAPGLIIALVLSATAGDEVLQGSLLQEALGLTIIVNAMNLLPFEPFDGGRVASIVLFANHPRARVVFGALSAVGLGLLAFELGAPGLGVVAALVASSAPARYRVATVAAKLRQRAEFQLTSLPARVADAPDALIRSIVEDWQAASGKTGVLAAQPRALATAATAVYELAFVPTASWLVRGALGAAYLLLLAPAAFIMIHVLR
jgi:Zn-dependent protease